MWTCNPQKRCAGADFARWPIFARSSCKLMVGFVIPLLPRFSAPIASGRAPLLRGRYPASSLIRTHPSGSRLHRTSPSGSRDYLASVGFLHGARSPSLFSPITLSACCRPLPRRAVPPQIAFGVTYCLRPYLASSAPGFSASRGLVQTFTRRCGPRPCSPRHAGLCRWASPPGFPMSAPPKLCGFDLLPLRDFHLMVSWVPPGITKPLQLSKAVSSRSTVKEPGPRGSQDDRRPPRGPGSGTIDHHLRPSPLTGRPFDGRAGRRGVFATWFVRADRFGLLDGRSHVTPHFLNGHLPSSITDAREPASTSLSPKPERLVLAGW